MNIDKSGLHKQEWKTRDPYSLVNDYLTTRTHCISLFRDAQTEWGFYSREPHIVAGAVQVLLPCEGTVGRTKT